MKNMLSWVVTVHNRAKLQQLKRTIVQMMELIEDASLFIVEYMSKARLAG